MLLTMICIASSAIRAQVREGCPAITAMTQLAASRTISRVAGPAICIAAPENRPLRRPLTTPISTTYVEYGCAAGGARLWKRVNQDPGQVQVWIGKIYEEKNDAQVPPVKHTLFHVFAGDQQVCTFEAGSSL